MGFFVWSFLSFLLLMTEPAAWVLALVLRVGAYQRADRLVDGAAVRRGLKALILFESLYLMLRFTSYLSPSVRGRMGPLIFGLDRLELAVKLVGVALCLTQVRRLPAWMVVAFGLAADAATLGYLCVEGRDYGDLIWSEVACWGIVFLGLRRVTREAKLERLRDNPLPLWMMYRPEAVPSRTEESR